MVGWATVGGTRWRSDLRTSVSVHRAPVSIPTSLGLGPVPRPSTFRAFPLYLKPVQISTAPHTFLFPALEIPEILALLGPVFNNRIVPRNFLSPGRLICLQMERLKLLVISHLSDNLPLIVESRKHGLKDRNKKRCILRG